jgi:predicted ester cyclase
MTSRIETLVDWQRHRHLHRELWRDGGTGFVSAWAEEAAVTVGAPIEVLEGRAGLKAGLIDRLLASFPDCEYRPLLNLSGRFKGGDWCSACGVFVGSFNTAFCGIAPTGRKHWLRVGWFDRIEGGEIVESFIMLDLAQLLIDTGQWTMRPQPGESWWPAPSWPPEAEGNKAQPDDSQTSLDLVEAMIGGLMSYDRQSLASMGMKRFWTPQFQWYGPGGIGSARGHANYEAVHQQPFLTAFPDRVGGNHKCRIGDGMLVASTGWPSIRATHLGSGWLGLSATNKSITMRVMDFWRREGDMLVENWVMIDMVDLLAQLGRPILASST